MLDGRSAEAFYIDFVCAGRMNQHCSPAPTRWCTRCTWGQVPRAKEPNRTRFRWWSTFDIVTSTERFYPGQLPALLRPFLDGGGIDEPFELWS